jgi:hypothetical protein
MDLLAASDPYLDFRVAVGLLLAPGAAITLRMRRYQPEADMRSSRTETVTGEIGD